MIYSTGDWVRIAAVGRPRGGAPTLPNKRFGLAGDKASRGPARGGGDAERTVRGHRATGATYDASPPAARCADLLIATTGVQAAAIFDVRALLTPPLALSA